MALSQNEQNTQLPAKAVQPRRWVDIPIEGAITAVLNLQLFQFTPCAQKYDRHTHALVFPKARNYIGCLRMLQHSLHFPKTQTNETQNPSSPVANQHEEMFSSSTWKHAKSDLVLCLQPMTNTHTQSECRAGRGKKKKKRIQSLQTSFWWSNSFKSIRYMFLAPFVVFTPLSWQVSSTIFRLTGCLFVDCNLQTVQRILYRDQARTLTWPLENIHLFGFFLVFLSVWCLALRFGPRVLLTVLLDLSLADWSRFSYNNPPVFLKDKKKKTKGAWGYKTSAEHEDLTIIGGGTISSFLELVKEVPPTPQEVRMIVVLRTLFVCLLFVFLAPTSEKDPEVPGE